MNTERTKCWNCDKGLKPYEGITYTQSKWAGKYYMGSDYYELCKPCYEKWRKEDKRKLKILAIIVLGIVVITVLIGLSIAYSN